MLEELSWDRDGGVDSKVQRMELLEKAAEVALAETLNKLGSTVDGGARLMHTA